MFDVIEKALAANPQALGALATTAGLLIFCGAMGKSAQFPLHVWLPDAMEGPTPVSALIHAATMVAAGVYMLCRVFFLLDVPGSQALEVIAWIGGITALLSAVIAVQQNDIKRILAYSTLSQLGYMVMAVGLHGPPAAMFHLTTHAFFKALLFLGAGSVIIALHHEQDIWNMGGLRTKMPVTFWTFMAGTLALAGVPPFSGFYSKDSILAQAAQHNLALFVLGAAVAALTTFYMFRLVFVAFLGAPRSDAAGHAHESPPVMVWPLRILAVFSVIGGLIGIEQLYATQFPAEHVEQDTLVCAAVDRSNARRAFGRPPRVCWLCSSDFLRLTPFTLERPKTRCRKSWARCRARCATASTSTKSTRLRSFGCTISWLQSPTGSIVGSSPASPCAGRTARPSWRVGRCACSKRATCRRMRSCSHSAWRWSYISP